MEAAVFPRVGQRFVAGVDDGAIELHPLEEIIVDVVRPLADLKMAVRTVAQQVAAQLSARSRTDPPGPGKEQAQGQKREQGENVAFGERRGTAHEVILVAAEGRA